MATLSDVAAVAGVSISAVSRVLSDAPSSRVSAATRQRIFAAAEQLEYRPNFAARALKSARTNVIGLVVPDLTNAIFAELMRGVEDEAHSRDYVVLLAREEAASDPGWINRLVREGRVDGVLVQIGDEVSGGPLNALIEGTTPVVLINSTHGGRASSVALPDEFAARLAVRHLLELGHHRIGLINGSPASATARRRGQGFAAEMADAGLNPAADHVTSGGYSFDQGRDAMRAILTSPHPPSAVVVANVNAGFGALLQAREQGFVVPDDLSVIAIHDAWTAATTWPPLSTVRMPLYELGRTAMGAVFNLLHHGAPEDLVVTDPEPTLVLRASTAAPDPE